ncbi:Zona pellucida sperm-binding protein 3 [Apodemus speciosus]|uniref:Zona pellucida sperm-binding protein 3 n=1 Tax=Apodemus speciosus TaxID=105296 RepID=A0ABQ0EU12_APOSI
MGVECLEAELVVTVSRDLFGTGKLVQPGDLTLGSEGCQPLVSVDTDAVRFKAQLHECSRGVQVTEDALVYSTFLLHDPRPVGGLSILRTNRVEVPIECRYPRQGNVSSQPIQPTWVPFRATVSSEERLAFSLRLMEENWGTEKSSPTFYLGEVARLQADVQTGSHPPLQLFVDHCVATPSPSPDPSASPYHFIVDSHGPGWPRTRRSACFCLPSAGITGALWTVYLRAFRHFKCLDPGQRHSSSRWTYSISPTAPEIRELYITCHLKVAPANQIPDKLNKACSFNKTSQSWSPVEGDADICDCCSHGNCSNSSSSPFKIHGPPQWSKLTSRNRRHV